MITYRYAELAAYNKRVAQGIVHTEEYVERMCREQEAFDAEPEQVPPPCEVCGLPGPVTFYRNGEVIGRACETDAQLVAARVNS